MPDFRHLLTKIGRLWDNDCDARRYSTGFALGCGEVESTRVFHMGTRTERFIAGLPVRDVGGVAAVDEVNNRLVDPVGARQPFFGRKHPETARVGFGGDTTAPQSAALATLNRQLRLARQLAPAREAVRQRIEEQRERYQREEEEAVRRQGRPPVQRRSGSLFRRDDDEHVVRELRPAGLPVEGPRLETPTPAYEPPHTPVRNGIHLDISA